ncbi:YppF family protein [Bacillus sp. 31A1R]|uniref:YppF family protein n=1 Tax=Robertmurraya mangrovi TaxID=3098077 RepID=A0ABU5J1I1_9BACI|nr:YppF family protein [Bacillus sp. 31A1R]MDZ5473216.1 YppF family protein [Bacillus sp. 31A1R]
MKVHELKEMFMKIRNYTTENPNELLDFAKKAYVCNEISISQYRKVVCELEAYGAELPKDEKENCLS